MPLIEHVNLRTALLIAFESILIVAAVAAATVLRLGIVDGTALLGTPDKFAKALLLAGVCQVCLYFGDLYNLKIVSHRGELVIRILQALAGASALLGVVYFWFPALIVGRGVFMIAASLVMTLVVAWRLAFEWIAGRVRPRERLLIVGTNPTAVALAREIHARQAELGVEIVGFIDPDPAMVGRSVFNPTVLGTLDDIPSIVRERGIGRVVVSLADARGRLRMEQLLEMKFGGVAFDHLATVYERFMGKIAIENLRPSWMIFSSGFRKTAWVGAAKRGVDVLASLILLVLAAPVMALVVLAIRITSAGPVLYHQARVGQAGRVFTLHKFRSMSVDAEAKTGAVWASQSDPRITAVGRVLRKTRLDELPQLWNVLRGEMSFVGPRPERPEFVDMLTAKIPYYRQRHAVKPGLTGWAQVRYSYGASVEDAIEKLQYDLFYIKYLSVGLDLLIMLQTIKTVVLHRGT
jgi:sugar transferase (PEP-CTERM system associated)